MNTPQERHAPYSLDSGYLPPLDTLTSPAKPTEPGKVPSGRLRQLFSLVNRVARRGDTASVVENITFLQTLADNSTDAIYLKDGEGRYLMVNATFAYWTRRTVDEIIGHTDHELFNRRVAEQLSQSDQQVMKDGKSLTEDTYLDGDDAGRHFVTTKVPFRDTQQQIIGVLGVARDMTHRKAMEEELRESQQFNEQIINSARGGVIVLDARLRFNMWNPFMEEFIGIPKTKVLGKLPLEIFPTAGESGLLQHLERAAQGTTVNRIDLNLDTARGTRSVWASCSFSPHRDGRGEIIGVIGTVTDITEYKKAEAALRRSQQFNQQVINNSSYGIVVYDRELRYMVWNPAMEEMSGLKAEQVLGRRVTEILPTVQEQGLPQMLQQALKGDTVESADFRLSPYKSFWVRANYSPLRDGDDQIIGVIGMVTNVTARRQAEEALRDAKQFNEQIINSSLEGIAVCDRDLRVLVWNPPMVEMTGIQRPQTEGKTVLELLPDWRGTEIESYLQKALAGEIVAGSDFQFSGNEERWASAVYGPLRNQHGKTVGVIITVRDITARRRAEAALRASQQFSEQVINSTLDCIVVHDTDLNYVLWNPAMERFAKVKAESALGKHPLKLFPHLRDNGLYAQMESALQGVVSERKDYEYTINESGELGWYNAQIAPLRDEQGEIAGVITVLRDVTDRHRAEEALRASKQFNEQIIHSVKEGIVVHDRSLRYVEWNPFMEQVRGLRRAEVVGKHPYEIFPELQQSGFAEIIQHVLTGEPTTTSDFEQVNEQGVSTWLSIRYEPLRTPDGEITGVLGVVSDITERKQAEEALRASQQFNEQIIANAREGIVVYDSSFRVIVWNRFMEEVTGLTQEQVRGRQHFEVFPYLRTTGHLNFLGSALGGDSITGQDFQMTAPHTGKQYWMSARYGPHVGPRGETIGVIMTLRDVTARRFAEQSVRESEERYRNILEAIQDGYFEFNLKGDLVLFNDALCRIYGADKTELFGQAHRRWISRATFDRVVVIFNEMLTSDEPSRTFDYELNRKDGQKRILEATLSVMRNAVGEPTGYRGLLRDISDRRAAELRLANQARYAALRADITAAVASDASLPEMLQRCVTAVISNLNVSFARIWLLDDDDATLATAASAGAVQSLGEEYQRIRLGDTKIGQLAAARVPYLSNQLQSDLQLSDQVWAKEADMTAFAGCPLVSNNLTLGVLAFWSKEALADEALDSLMTITALMAQGIEKRQIEHSLQSSEDRFRALIEHSYDGVLLMNDAGCATYASPAQQQILGYAEADLIGKPFESFIHPDSRDLMRKALAELAAGASTRLEYRARNAQGEYRWLEGTITNLLHEAAVQSYVLNFHDVTAAKLAEAQRAQAEASLRTSEEQMRSIWTNVLDAMLLLDDEGYYTDANPAACDLFGLSQAELIGQHFSIFTGAEHAELANEAWQKLMREGRDEGVFEMPLPGRGTRWIEFLSLANVVAGRHLIVYRDVTERRDAEAAVRASEARHRALTENSWDGITLLDVNGRTVYVSPSFTRILGYSADEALKSEPKARIHPDDLEKLQALRAELLERPGEQFTFEYRGLHKDGSWRVLQCAATNLLDDPNINAIVVNFRDITERQQAEEAIRQREEKFRAIWNNAMDAMLIVNDQMEYVDANPAACELYGLKREDLLHRSMPDFVPEEKREQAQKSLEKLVAQGERKGQFQLLRPDHTIREIEYSARANFMPNLHLSMMRDVTERVRAEDQMRASEERYRSVVSALDEGLLMIGSEGELLACNQSASRLLGMPREEILLTNITDPEWQAVHEDGTAFTWEESPAFHTLQTGEPQRGIVWGLKREGTETKWFSINSHPVFQGEAEKPYAVVLSLNDLTERKRAEAAQAASEMRFAAIFQASPLPISITEAETSKLCDTNPAWLDYFGLTAEKAKDRTALELGIWERPTDHIDYLEVLRREGRVSAYDMWVHSKDGAPRHALASAEALEINGKRYYLHLTQDITERKQAEQRFSRAFEANPNPTVIISLKQRRIVQANEAWQKFSGYQPEEFAQLPELGDGNWVHSAQRKYFYDQLELRGRIRDFECELATRDGKARTILLSAELIEIDGQTHVIASANDITERKRAEEALRVSEERFSKAFDACPDPMAITTVADGRFVMINAAWLRVHGLKSENVIGHTWQELELWVDGDARRRFSEQIVLHGSVRDFETQLRNASGGTDHVLISAEMVMLDSEWHILSVTRNITERKRAEEALRASEMRFASTFNACPEAMALARWKDGRFVAMNDAALRSMGLSLKDVIEKTAEELGMWVDVHQQAVFVSTLKKHGEVRDFECQMNVKGGRVGDFLLSAEILKLDGQQYFLTVARDVTERKRAEAALRATEEQLARTFDACPEPMSLNRLDNGCGVAINRAALNLFGWQPEDFIGVHYKDVPFWFDEARLQVFKERLKQDGVLKDFEVETRIKDGSNAHFLISAELLHLNNVPHLLCVGRDITARKKAEEDLRASEARFSKAFNASPHPMTISHLPSGNFLMVNEAWCALHGFTAEEVIGKNSATLGLWVEQEKRQEVFAQVLATGSLRNFECELLDKNGGRHTLLMSAEMIEVGGEPYLLSIALDMTERRQAEAALRVSEERFEQAFRLSPHPMLISTMDGRIVQANQAVTQVTGYTLDEMIGKSPHELKLWDSDEQRAELLAEIRRTGSIHNREMVFRDRHGKRLQALYSSEKVEFNGQPHTLSSLVDITEIKRIETELRASQERFATAFQASPQAMLICKTNGEEIVAVNESFSKLVGWHETDLLGRTGDDLGLWAEASAKQELMTRLKANEPIRDLPFSITHKSGEMRFINMTVEEIHLNDEPHLLFLCNDVTERLRAEEALRASEERFSKAFQASPQAMLIAHAVEGNIVSTNQSLCLLLGYDEAEVLGRTIEDLQLWVKPHQRDTFKQLLKHNGHLRDWTTELRRKTGEHRTVQISVEPVQLNGAEHLLYLLVDITERKQSEEALRASEERFSTAFQSNPQPMAILRASDQKFVLINQAFSRAMGKAENEIVGHAAAEIGWWTETAVRREFFAQLEQRRNVRDYEAKLSTDTQETRTHLLSAEFIRLDQQPHILVIALDITERHRAEAALRASEELFSKAFQASPQPMALAHWPSGELVRINRKLSEVTGYEAADIIGTRLIDSNAWLTAHDRNHFLQAAARGSFRDWEVRLRMKSGEIATMQLSGESIELEGKPHLLVTATDITARKRAEAIVAGQVRTLELMASGAHLPAVLDTVARFVDEQQFGARTAVNLLSPSLTRIQDCHAPNLSAAFRQVLLETELSESSGVNGAAVAAGHLVVYEDLSQHPRWAACEELLTSQQIRAAWAIPIFDTQHRVLGTICCFYDKPHSPMVAELKLGEIAAQLASIALERHEAEEALRVSEGRYRLLFERNLAGVYRVGLDGKFIECNDAYAAIFGMQSAKEVLRHREEDLYLEREERGKLIHLLEKNKSVTNYEMRMRRADQTDVWVLANASLLQAEGEPVVIEGVLLDITKRKQAEAKLSEQREQLRALTAKVSAVREEERTVISREIHDSLGQLLTGLKLDISWLGKRINQQVEGELRKQLLKKTDSIAELLDQTIGTVRELATQLRPGVLDTLGLTAAIEWLVQDFQARSGIECEQWLCPEPKNLSSEKATVVFRILQEILTNIIRHAEATRVVLHLMPNNESLLLTVIDNGRGITPTELQNAKSLGLLGMRERANSIGGDVKFDGAPGRGTTVTVRIPLGLENGNPLLNISGMMNLG